MSGSYWRTSQRMKALDRWWWVDGPCRLVFCFNTLSRINAQNQLWRTPAHESNLAPNNNALFVDTTLASVSSAGADQCCDGGTGKWRPVSSFLICKIYTTKSFPEVIFLFAAPSWGTNQLAYFFMSWCTQIFWDLSNELIYKSLNSAIERRWRSPADHLSVHPN